MSEATTGVLRRGAGGGVGVGGGGMERRPGRGEQKKIINKSMVISWQCARTHV